jgi:carbonic anhydrase
VRQSIARLAANPFLLHTDNIRGFVYNVADGTLEEVTS